MPIQKLLVLALVIFCVIIGQNCGRFSPLSGTASLALSSAIPNSIATPPLHGGPITKNTLNVLRGWGMSLAWEANDLYGGGRGQVAQITNPALQSAYMDMLYGDPDQQMTLGLNVARYNIGGGENPTHTHMRTDAQMDGFLSAQGGTYDWTKDASQIRMLHEAKNRGANIFEAFSNSPPYWMTNSGCASGGSGGYGQENLNPAYDQQFADYLVTVVKHMRDVEGIEFESLEPFNEPDGQWWTAYGSQEGNFALVGTQNTVLPLVAQALKGQALSTFVSGVDSNNFDNGLAFLKESSPNALNALGRVNVHTYGGSNSTGLRAEMITLGKPLWQSEVGCCFGGQGDGTPMWGALFISDRIREALRDLRSETFIFWQPDWNVIDFNGGNPLALKQFYAIAQASKFIRPGYQIITSSADAGNALIAFSANDQRLVIVVTDWSPQANTIDLSSFTNLPETASRYVTTDSVDIQKSSIGIVNNRIQESLTSRAIVTYVIEGLTLSP